jgi:hypothetical protein
MISPCGENLGARATYRLPVERPNEGVSISIFGCCDGSFRLDDGVNTSNFGVVSSYVLNGGCVTYLDWQLLLQSQRDSDFARLCWFRSF